MHLPGHSYNYVLLSQTYDYTIQTSESLYVSAGLCCDSGLYCMCDGVKTWL
jgi:hypothetical protein